MQSVVRGPGAPGPGASGPTCGRLTWIKPAVAPRREYRTMKKLRSNGVRARAGARDDRIAGARPRPGTGCMVALALALIGGAAPAAAGDPDRGRALYETRCVECHDASVHRRETRKATTFEGVLAQVSRWNANLGGAWTAAEIEDVAVYLNWRYYRHSCPESVCGPRRASLPRALAVR